MEIDIKQSLVALRRMSEWSKALADVDVVLRAYETAAGAVDGLEKRKAELTASVADLEVRRDSVKADYLSMRNKAADELKANQTKFSETLKSSRADFNDEKARIEAELDAIRGRNKADREMLEIYFLTSVPEFAIFAQEVIPMPAAELNPLREEKAMLLREIDELKGRLAGILGKAS